MSEETKRQKHFFLSLRLACLLPFDTITGKSVFAAEDEKAKQPRADETEEDSKEILDAITSFDNLVISRNRKIIFLHDFPSFSSSLASFASRRRFFLDAGKIVSRLNLRQLSFNLSVEFLRKIVKESELKNLLELNLPNVAGPSINFFKSPCFKLSEMNVMNGIGRAFHVVFAKNKLK